MGWARAPYPARAEQEISIEVREFAIVPLHAAPLDAVAEMDLLYDVYLDVRQKWDLEVSPRPQALGVCAVCPRPSGCHLPLGHHALGRLQRWLQLRGPHPVGLHPPAHKPGLPVADP